MHTIRGRLSRAEHVQKAGMAMLSITLEQVGAGGITSQPIEALRSYGNSEAGHAAAHAACASLVLGGLYAVRGKGLSATGGQVWLLGVSHWHVIAPARTEDEVAPIPRTFIVGGARARHFLQSLAGAIDA